MESTDNEPEAATPPRSRNGDATKLLSVNWSLKGMLLFLTFVALLGGNLFSIVRLRTQATELGRLRQEVGALPPNSGDQVAAARVPVNEPLMYRFRVRVPGAAESSNEPSRWSASTMPPMAKYRIAYSSLLPRGKTQPDWYAAIALEPGESLVTIRIAEDPRDERWKISTLVRDQNGTRRIGTVLPDSHRDVFRTSHDVVSTGITQQGIIASPEDSVRLLDERWLVAEQALLLYGDRAPNTDQIGIYAELQPTNEPLSKNDIELATP